MSALAQKLCSHDARVMARLVASAIQRQALPEWQSAWDKLSELGRRVLLSAPPEAVFTCALDCWAASPATALERAIRRTAIGMFADKYHAQAVREIGRAQIQTKTGTLEVAA